LDEGNMFYLSTPLEYWHVQPLKVSN
jgi:hypothetical protein